MSSNESTPSSSESPLTPSEAPAPTPEPAATAGAQNENKPVEKVRKIYVRDLKAKERIHTVFLVSKKVRQVSRNGKPFLALVLADKTGEVDGRIFDNVDELEKQFLADDYLLVLGQVISFHGRPQLLVESLARLDPEPIDPREFAVPRPQHSAELPNEGKRSVAQIREMVELVEDPNVKALLFAFLDDPDIAEGLRHAPAAKGIHHAYKGGLADHILSVMKLAQRIADHYPMADRDLLLAGALLHDIGKVQELSYEKNFEYTDEGQLVGHLVMTAQKIREKASRLPNFPRLLEQHITHLVLAHHGHLEFGSPKLPVTLEAFIVHMIDLLDSRVASWLELMAKDSNEKWTEVSRLYERHLWKGPLPTIRGKGPVDGRAKKKEGNERRRFRVFTPQPPSGDEVRPKPDHPRVERKSTEQTSLSFKPLSELTRGVAASPPEAPPSEMQTPSQPETASQPEAPPPGNLEDRAE